MPFSAPNISPQGSSAMARRKRASYRVCLTHANAIHTMAMVFKQYTATRSNIELYNPSRASKLFLLAISSRSVTQILSAESEITKEEDKEE